MPKYTRVTFDKVVIIACVVVIFIVFPGVLLYWSMHPEAEQQAAQQQAASLPDAQPPPELPDDAGPPPVQPGTKATDFTSTTVEGKKFVFNSQSPNIKVVDFWATWCGPCHMSIPELEDIDQSLRKSGVRVIGVSLDTDTADQVAPLVKELKMNYTVLVDPTKNIVTGTIYNATALPSLYIIDGKGIIRWSFAGYWPDEERYVRMIISEIQNGQQVG